MLKFLTDEETNRMKEQDDELDFEDLFDDEDLEEDEEEIEDEADETEGDQAEEKPAAAEGTIRIKYNGEEKDITIAEAIELAQKGYNYDKIKGENDAWKARSGMEATDLVESLAEENGMSIADYIKFASENLSKSSVNAQIRQLQKERPDLPEDVIRELAESRAAKKSAQVKAEREAKEQAPWDELAEAYPDLKSADDLPTEVRELIANGKSPLMAMQTHEIAQLKKKIAEQKKASQTREKNEKNRRDTVGSVKGSQKPQMDEIEAILLAED